MQASKGPARHFLHVKTSPPTHDWYDSPMIGLLYFAHLGIIQSNLSGGVDTHSRSMP